MKKKIILMIVTSLVVGGLLVLSSTKDRGKPIKIGVATAQTGFASVSGVDELRAAELAVELMNRNGGINGKTIELIVEDTQSDNVQTTNAVKKLIEVDRVPAIIGTTWAEIFPGIDLAEEHRVVLLSPSATLEVAEETKEYKYLFSTWWPQQPEIDTLQKFMSSHHFVDVAIIHDNDPFDEKMATFFSARAASNQLHQPIGFEVAIGEKDFRTVLLKVAQQRFDAVFVSIQDIAQLGNLMKQMKELGIKTEVFSTTSTQNEQLLRDSGSAIEGIYYSYPNTIEDEKYHSILAQYEKRFGTKPFASSFVNAYNATLVLVEVLKGGATTGEEIRKGLEKVKIQGIGTPEVSFTQKGQISSVKFLIKTVKGGRFVEVE